MILKIGTGTNRIGHEVLPKESWRFFDGVEGLHYSLYPSESHFRQEVSKWATPQDVQEVWIAEDKPVDDEILFLSFDSARTGPIHLFCNTTVYLLNDQGRTIEKLL